MDDTAQSAREGAAAFDLLDLSARQAGRSIAAALSGAQIEGRKLEDVLRGVGQRLGEMAIQAAGSAVSQAALPGLTTSLFSAVAGIGSGIANSSVQSGSGGGGPSSQAQAARPLAVTMNISTPDADSFRQSEAQVSAALARVVARGQRGM